MTSITQRNFVRRVASGDRVSTSDHNRLVEAVRSDTIGAVAAGPQGLTSHLLEIQAINLSPFRYLTCWPRGGNGTEAYVVILPAIYTELSRTFSFGTVTYTYDGVDFNQRTASRSGFTDVTQYLTPPFVVGELVSVEWSEEFLSYLAFGDGRMWGEDPPPPP